VLAQTISVKQEDNKGTLEGILELELESPRGNAMPLFQAQLNPLKCHGIDLDPGATAPSEAQLLDWLFTPEGDRGCETFVNRYREVDCDDTLFLAPNEKNLLQKLVWPLRHAKGSYALGNYLSCIALCGMVGEMVALLLWDISKLRLKEKPWDEKAQTAIFGSTFEKLGQARRIKVLCAVGVVKSEFADVFEALRNIRNKYLHLLSQPHERAASDAKQAYRDATKLVEIVLGVRLEGGAVVLRQDLVTYLIERGIIEAASEKQE
jgi:hypothetical protein